MKFLIIGTGNVGGTLASRISALGHTVKLFNRSGVPPEGFSYKDVCTDINKGVLDSDIVMMCTPYGAVANIINSVSNWSNTIIIDTTNPISPGLKALSVGNTSSGAETIAQMIPNATVIKAFNTTGWENMKNPDYGEQKLAMFYAGDDLTAKEKIKNLIIDLSFDPFDAGDLYMSRFLEPLAIIWIRKAIETNNRSGFGFSVIKR